MESLHLVWSANVVGTTKSEVETANELPTLDQVGELDGQKEWPNDVVPA